MIKIGDTVHLKLSEQTLSDIEADALSEMSDASAGRHIEKLSDHGLKWKVTVIEKGFAEVKPIGFRFSPISMFPVKELKKVR